MCRSRIGQYRVSENRKHAGTLIHARQTTIDDSVVRTLVSTRRALARERLTNVCMGIDGEKVFVKTTCIRGLPARFRISLGLRRSSGAYDWPVAELRNNLEARKRAN